MKAFKKSLAVVLAVLMTFSLCAAALADPDVCTHYSSRVFFEEITTPFCGAAGNIEHWYCSICHKSFPDKYSDRELSEDEVYCYPAEYEEHDIQYEVGFTALEDRAYLSYPAFMDVLYQYDFDITVPEYYAQQGYTFWYCSHCGVVMCIHGDYYPLDEYLFTPHIPGVEPHDPNAGYILLPPADSEGLEYGDYCFDYESYLAYRADVEGEEVFEAIRPVYEGAAFYLSPDGQRFKSIVLCNAYYDFLTDPLYLPLDAKFLRQYGIDPMEGFEPLPLDFNDEMQPGDRYLDKAATRTALTGLSLRKINFYINDETDTIRLDAPTYTRDVTPDSAYGSLFDCVRYYGAEEMLTGFVPVTLGTESIPYGGEHYFRIDDYIADTVADMVAAREAAGEAPFTAEELSLIADGMRANVSILENTEKNKIAIVDARQELPTIFSLESPEGVRLASYFADYDPWIDVVMANDDLTGDEYWFDVATHLDVSPRSTSQINYYIRFHSMSILPGVAAIRYAETDPRTSETTTSILTPDAEDEEIAALYHMLAVNIYHTFVVNKAPACLENGYENAVGVEKNGETVIVKNGSTIRRLEHDFDDSIAENVTIIEATCTENGKKTVKCSRCEATEETIYYYFGHDYGEWVVTKEPTDIEQGEHVRECKICHYVDVEPIPVLEGNRCKYCGRIHDKTFMGRLKAFFHKILHFFSKFREK